MGQVNVKHEKDIDNDELMITPIPTPTPKQQDFTRNRSQSSCLPFLNRSFFPSLDDESHPYRDHEHHIHIQEPRLVEVHDDDQMWIQQESQSRPNVVDGDAESVSSVVTIRQVPLSPISNFEEQSMEEREFALANTIEYQSALFEMLEEMCTDAARRYWQDVASQGRFCLLPRRTDTAFHLAQLRQSSGVPYRQTGTQPIRTSRSNERLRTRHRVDPYPIRRADSNLPQNHGMRSHIYNFYDLRSNYEDEDTRMTPSLTLSSASVSTETPTRHNSRAPLKFLELISKIVSHIWRTERYHPAAPHRAEYLASRKCWDVWRLAEVVVKAVDGYDGFSDERVEGLFGGAMGRKGVVKVVRAAGELCEMLGDERGKERCVQLVDSWEVDSEEDGLEEGEIVE